MQGRRIVSFSDPPTTECVSVATWPVQLLEKKSLKREFRTYAAVGETLRALLSRPFDNLEKARFLSFIPTFFAS